jgi:hypothetical protein
MTFHWGERVTSRSGSVSPPSLTLKYVASGTSDDLFVRSYAINATPAIYGTAQGVLYRQDIRIEAESASVFYVDVPYGPKEKETGSFTLSFDTQGGTVHITSSKSTIGKYPNGVAPDYKQAIGVHGDEVDGCDVVVPALKLQLTYKHPAGIISLPRIKLLALATGTVNSDTFLTFPPGSVLFLGCSGTEGTATETEITYHFACSENADSLTVGDITGINKKGHDYLWVSFKDDVDGGRAVKVPQFVYVERVYKFASLSGILGFGG